MAVKGGRRRARRVAGKRKRVLRVEALAATREAAGDPVSLDDVVDAAEGVADVPAGRPRRMPGRPKAKASGRKPGARYNKATAALFIGELSRGCNVTRAARTAKVPIATVYNWRRTDSGFRDAWADALVEGYLTLETLVLGSAIDALDDRRRSARTVERRGSIGDATRLLALHRQSVRERLVQAGNEAETQRAGAELEVRLAEIRVRLTRTDAVEVARDG